MIGLFILIGLCLIFGLGFVAGAMWAVMRDGDRFDEDEHLQGDPIPPPPEGFSIDRSDQGFWNAEASRDRSHQRR